MAATSTIIKNASGGYTINIKLNGVNFSDSIYSAKSLLVAKKLYSTDGVTIKETDNYGYDTKGYMSTQERLDANGKLIEKVSYTYTAKKQFDTATHYDPNNKVTAIDYYVNGMLDHVVKPNVAPVVSDSTWSNICGYGQVNLIKALSLATEKVVEDVTSSIKLGWDLLTSHFDDAWNIGYTGKGQVIANIDTGIDLNNKALNQNISKYSWNFVNNTSNVQDDNGHGSFTASEIIAKPNNNGVVGGAYDAELMVLKAMDKNGNGSVDNIAKAITYAVDHGADVINMSLNTIFNQPAIESALKYAQSHDVLVSVSSGNNLSNSPTCPAIYAKTNSNVVAVGATFSLPNKPDNFNAVSNKAGTNTAFNYVDALGTNIEGYDQTGQITKMSGTSMASPLVAAEMAILKQCLESIGKFTNDVIDQKVMEYVTHGTDTVGLIGVLPIQDSLLVA